MAYTTISKEIADKCPELSERIGETISQKELAKITAKYEDAKAKPVAPRIRKPSAPKAKVTRRRR